MTMETIPKTVPPLPRSHDWGRHLPAATALTWLASGWADLKSQPLNSLLYGFAVFVVSMSLIGAMFRFQIDYLLFPAISAFMVAGPAIAIGLYEKSRRLTAGEPVTLSSMIFVRPRSGGQILFIGVLLCLLVMLWMRAAVLIYALFFGMHPFLGMDTIAVTLVTTPVGWSLLLVGGCVGALFAAFAYAISVFSIPMLLEEKLDAFTAMGTSMALVWNNLPVMLTWGAIVLVLFTLSAATAFVGLIVAFPVLGHATWHAFKAMRS